MSTSFLNKLTNFKIVPKKSSSQDNNYVSDKSNLDALTFYQILNSSKDIIFILQKDDWEVLYANGKALEVFHSREIDNNQQSKIVWTDLFDPASSKLLKESLKNLSLENEQNIIIEHSKENEDLKIHFNITIIASKSGEKILCKGISQTAANSLNDKLIQDNSRLENIMQYSDNLYFEITLRGQILYVSNSIKHLTGYSQDEVKNKNLFEFYANEADKNHHHKELLKKGEINNSRIDLIDKAGALRNVIANSFVVKDENGKPFKIVGSLRDETETNHLLSLLEESELKYRTLLDNAGAIIIYLDNHGEIILINRRAATFFGIETADLMNKNFFSNPSTKSLADHLNYPFMEVIDDKKGQALEVNFELTGQAFSLMTNLQPVFDARHKITGVALIASNVTDEREAQREMRKLQIAIEQSTASITITNKIGIIEYANSRYCELTGFSPDNIIGKLDYIFSEKNNKKEYFIEMQEKLSSREVWKGEFENLKKNGELFWEKVIISPVISEEGELINFISVREDISDSKRIKEFELETIKSIKVLNETSLSFLKLDDEANVFQLIGDQLAKIAPDSYFLIGSYNPNTKLIQNQYIHIDQTVLKLFYNKSNFSKDKINLPLQDDQLEILRNGDWQYFENGLNQLTAGKISLKMSSFLMSSFNIEKIERKGIFEGDILMGTIALISRKGQQPINMNLINTFLNQVSIGIERFNLRHDLIMEKNKSDEMNRIKSTFLANMSHELRTPLNGILGFSELLIDQIEEERYCDMIRVINKSGLRLLDTLNTILDFSTIEGKNIILNYIEEDIVETVRKVIRKNFEEAEKKGLLLTLKTNINSLKTFTANNLVEKILYHLIKNGIKFTNKGEVEVRISEKGSNRDKKIHISVIDTGIGIQASDLENIFQEFRQGSEGLTRKFEGTGLGLTISKKFATLLKGDIMVSSLPEKGSDFTLIIPHYNSPPINILN